jgi:hypothetical protein
MVCGIAIPAISPDPSWHGALAIAGKARQASSSMRIRRAIIVPV